MPLSCNGYVAQQHVSSLYPYNESSRFLQHVSSDLPNCVVPQTKRLQS